SDGTGLRHESHSCAYWLQVRCRRGDRARIRRQRRKASPQRRRSPRLIINCSAEFRSLVCPVTALEAASATILGCAWFNKRDRMISLFGKNEPEPTLLERLKKSVSKTKAVLSEAVDTVFLGERK